MASSLEPGTHAFVRYEGFPVWHERILLAHISDSTWVIATPDFDLYPELLSEDNEDLDAVRIGGTTRRLPPGIGGAPTYRMRPLTARELRDLIAEGEEIAALERPPTSPQVSGDGREPAEAREHLEWRLVVDAGRDGMVGDLVKTTSELKRIDEFAVDRINGRGVSLGRSHAMEGKDGFLSRYGLGDTPSVPEARVLPVFTRGDGERVRTWESVCDEVAMVEFISFGVNGPRTAMWCVRFLRRQQMHPEDYHRQWRSRHGLSGVDWGVTAHASALRAVALAGCCDQLDLPNLSVIEHLLRDGQMVEYHYKNVEREKEDKLRRDKKVTGPTIDESELFLGVGKSAYESMICPDLTDWIAKQLERDANILKSTRKAREERAQSRK